jgi:RHS repeat-associated protein
VVARHDYLPFGEEVQASQFGRDGRWGPGNDSVNQKFTGKERDSESGLDYFGARYYGSALGRFTSPDWSSAPQPVPYANLRDPQTLNLYAYVGNNPLARADLDGHGWREKLKNFFGDAGCWCEGEQAKSAALRNLYAEQRRQQEEVRQWRIAMKNPAYHIAMAMAMGPMGPVSEELEAAAAETAGAEEAAEEEAVLEGANYAQRTFGKSFSSAGIFAGRTVEEVAAALRSGEINAADVPVQYIIRGGNKLILNTRSAQALEQAGIPRSQWNSVNMTGDAAAEAR